MTTIGNAPKISNRDQNVVVRQQKDFCKIGFRNLHFGVHVFEQIITHKISSSKFFPVLWD
jgi:hypothetical protein